MDCIMQNNIFDYAALLRQVKARVALVQKKAIYAANGEMLSMYNLPKAKHKLAGQQYVGAVARWFKERLSESERFQPLNLSGWFCLLENQKVRTKFKGNR